MRSEFRRFVQLNADGIVISDFETMKVPDPLPVEWMEVTDRSGAIGSLSGKQYDKAADAFVDVLIVDYKDALRAKRRALWTLEDVATWLAGPDIG